MSSLSVIHDFNSFLYMGCRLSFFDNKVDYSRRKEKLRDDESCNNGYLRTLEKFSNNRSSGVKEKLKRGPYLIKTEIASIPKKILDCEENRIMTKPRINFPINNVDKNCNICHLQILKDIYNDGSHGVKKKSKSRSCAIKAQIAFLHKRILGCEESSIMSKPKMNFSVDNGQISWRHLILKYSEYYYAQELLLKVLQYKRLNIETDITFKIIDNFVYIETVDDLKVILEDLQNYNELGVNLEYHSLRSYLGFTWLIQISTESTDYLINALMLRTELHILNIIFMNPSILKIFYKGENNIHRLQKEFSLFVVNLFDMETMKEIIIQHSETKSLNNKICFIDQKHTRFLLYFKLYLTMQFLILFGREKTLDIMYEMRIQGIKMCRENYYRPLSAPNISIPKIYEKENINQITSDEFYIMTEFYKWRDKIARDENESPNYIISDNEMVKIVRDVLFAEKANTEKFKFVKSVNNKNYTLNLFDIVRKSKEIKRKQVNLTKVYNKRIKYQSCKTNITKETLNFKSRINIKRINQIFFPHRMLPYNYCIERPSILSNKAVIQALQCQVPLNLCLEKHVKSRYYCRPYKIELENFVTPHNQLVEQLPITFKPIKNAPLYIINKKKKLQKMLTNLRNYNEMAIDLKYTVSKRSCTRLMQISTRDSDYIIDTLVLQSNLHILNDVFTNPNVLKVFHKSYVKILRLQKDLSLYIVNMFDIAIAAKILKKKLTCLKYLKYLICKIGPPTALQIKNWEMQLLTPEVKNDTCNDTHYLLFIKDILSNELFSQSNLLKEFYDSCISICKNIYYKPTVLKENIKIKYDGHSIRLNVIKELNKWRNKIAIRENVKLKYILSDKDILKLADKLPNDRHKLLEICNSYMIKKHISEIYSIISSAKNLWIEIGNEYQYSYNDHHFKYIDHHKYISHRSKYIDHRCKYIRHHNKKIDHHRKYINNHPKYTLDDYSEDEHYM